MTKKRLIVFAGKPGVGKSSIIKKISDGYTVVDVWNFMVPLLENGNEVPPEEKNIVGYQAMYTHLAQLDQPRVILELGTNYPEFNVAQLTALLVRYEIDLLLCDASISTCRARVHERGFRFGGEGTERRLQRDFPNMFLKELKSSPLRHHVISTEGSIDTVCAMVKEKFQI